jgi:hypothetical protein
LLCSFQHLRFCRTAKEAGGMPSGPAHRAHHTQGHPSPRNRGPGQVCRPHSRDLVL